MGNNQIGYKGQQLLAVMWVETSLAGGIIALRWYTRTYVGGRVGPDDFLLMAAWVLMCAFTCLISAAVHYGMGTHVGLLDVEQITHGVLMILIGQSCIALAMGLSKCAVAIFLMRIVTKTWHKMILWFWIISIMIFSILVAIAVFAQCTPTRSIWDPRVKAAEGQVCHMNLALVAEILCSWSAAMDFFLAIYPWYVLWSVNIKRKERITICISLSLGVFAGICGVIRTTGLDAINKTSDYLFAVSDSVMWTTSELTLTIICVCIPALRPLYNRVTGGSSSGGQGPSGPYYQQNDTKGTGTGTGTFKMDTMGKDTSKAYDVEIGTGHTKNLDSNSDDFIMHNTDKAEGGSSAIRRSQLRMMMI
ncbi:Satratoxin biosynthesis SC1 cluster protein 4 [Lachnellula cervina]|uniref:Satratoxin biosynthesis SC1 cluster protein 4 n=1 Tax=Lachnellula cervina TaxID=1316786 RepID=A0A7D8YUF6_9HELO|nr:Satratoxin biosynthesis SC1 cluster protein 4 [Lachnellula cervina]